MWTVIFFLYLTAQAAILTTASPSGIQQRASASKAILDIDVSSNQGKASDLASGILYGLPNSISLGNPVPKVPAWLYNNLKLRFVRAGGAQSPKNGYGANSSGGLDGYRSRFASVVEYWRTFKSKASSDARFIILPHDLWGADSTTSDLVWPCDDNNCSHYETFLDQLIKDMKSNGMTGKVDLDIWNEPDNAPFWGRSQEQYLQQYNFAYRKYRDAFSDADVRLVGPSTVEQPQEDSDWWRVFLQNIKQENTIPDVYSWHLLYSEGGCGNDAVYAQDQLGRLLQQFGLPQNHPQQVNEWGESGQSPPQEPNYSAWHIARYERTNIEAVRGNYGFGIDLHDNLAGLISNSTGYKFYPVAEWQVATAYANMTGSRLRSTSNNQCVDLFATKDDSKKVLTVLLGAKGQNNAGQFTIRFSNTASLQSVFGSGKVKVQIDTFAYDRLQPAYKPSESHSKVVSVSKGTLSFSFDYGAISSAYRLILSRV